MSGAEVVETSILTILEDYFLKNSTLESVLEEIKNKKSDLTKTLPDAIWLYSHEKTQLPAITELVSKLIV